MLALVTSARIADASPFIIHVDVSSNGGGHSSKGGAVAGGGGIGSGGGLTPVGSSRGSAGVVSSGASASRSQSQDETNDGTFESGDTDPLAGDPDRFRGDNRARAQHFAFQFKRRIDNGRSSHRRIERGIIVVKHDTRKRYLDSVEHVRRWCNTGLARLA